MLNNDYGISEINMDGFQVVRGQLFSRMLEPFMSIWYSSISFNAACYSALNECAAIQLLVNSHDRRVLVKPTPSSDRDSINWSKEPDKHKCRKIECSNLMHQIFDMWGLDKELHYRANGKLVTADRKIMLLFDFNRTEAWRGLKMVNGLE